MVKLAVTRAKMRSQYDVTRIENNNGSRRNSSLGGRTGWKAGNRRGYQTARRKGRFVADRFSWWLGQPAAQANFLGRLFQEVRRVRLGDGLPGREGRR